MLQCGVVSLLTKVDLFLEIYSKNKLYVQLCAMFLAWTAVYPIISVKYAFTIAGGGYLLVSTLVRLHDLHSPSDRNNELLHLLYSLAIESQRIQKADTQIIWVRDLSLLQQTGSTCFQSWNSSSSIHWTIRNLCSWYVLQRSKKGMELRTVNRHCFLFWLVHPLWAILKREKWWSSMCC